jgi:hypothetical protein
MWHVFLFSVLADPIGHAAHRPVSSRSTPPRRATGLPPDVTSAASRDEAARLKQAGEYVQAATTAERALSAEGFGRNAPRAAGDIDALGRLYDNLGRFAETETIALTAREKAHGGDRFEPVTGRRPDSASA